MRFFAMSIAQQTHLLPLAALQCGESAVIEMIDGEPGVMDRLHSMGFHAGAFVRMLTPGRSCAVRVGDSRIVLRGEQLSGIHVSLLS